MNKFLKVLLWIGGIGALVVGLTFGFYILYESSEQFDEGTKFAKSTSKNGCLVEMASRVSDCSGASCLMQNIGFAGACLAAAEGDRSKYCVGDQAVTALPENYCEEHQTSKFCGQAIIGTVSGYCKGDFEGL